MTRALLALAGLVLALAGWDALLAAREARAAREASGVGTVFTPAEAEKLRQQPGLRVELAGASHSYGRVQKQWRCLSYHQAPVDARALQGVIDGIVHAEGLVHAHEVEEAPAYGINTPSTIRISIQGPRALADPGGDVLATLEIGTSQPEHETSFVRRKGEKEIWSVSGDLRAALEQRVAPGLPPLLEPAVVPSAWLSEGGGAWRIRVERATDGLTLERRDRPQDKPPSGPGELPWTWVIDPAGAARELPDTLASAYASYLERLPYVDVLEASTKDALGLAQPVLTITIEGREVPPLRLVFGPATQSGRVPLWLDANQTLYLVEPSVLALAAPASTAFAADAPDAASGGAWAAALKAGGH